MGQGKDKAWVDFLEKELEESLQKDYELILSEDKDAQKLVGELKGIRKACKQSESTEIPKDDLYYQKLQNQIMQKIEQTKPESSVRIWLSRSSWQLSMAASITLLLIGISYFSLLNQGEDESTRFAKLNGTEWLLDSSARDVQGFSNTIINAESEESLAFGSLENEMENLSDQEARQLFDQLVQ